jgi:predicted metal-dependent hydrolase
MVRRLTLGETSVDVILKDIKNIHLSVHPPTGRVRISAPSRMSMDTIRVFAISKLDWIKRHQSALRRQQRETRREYLDRESHYAWGKRYLLKVIECDEPPLVELKHTQMLLRVRPGAEDGKKHAVIEEWYREQIKQSLPPLFAKWEPVLAVRVERFFVQRMRTKWGSCNHRTRSIRLNTDLAKKPPEFLEYIVVHEMAHLIEHRHNDRFGRLMDRCLSNWRLLRLALNDLPLSHTGWTQ